jgi:hypothetical protein
MLFRTLLTPGLAAPRRAGTRVADGSAAGRGAGREGAEDPGTGEPEGGASARPADQAVSACPTPGCLYDDGHLSRCRTRRARCQVMRGCTLSPPHGGACDPLPVGWTLENYCDARARKTLSELSGGQHVPLPAVATIRFQPETAAILRDLRGGPGTLVRPRDIEAHHVAYYGDRPEVRARARLVWARVRDRVEE